jgi:ribosomal protein L15E
MKKVKKKHDLFYNTLIEKRGQKIERASRIWNRVRHATTFGYKLPTLGYYDGKGFVPIDFSLHWEKGENKKTSCRGPRPRQMNVTRTRSKLLLRWYAGR